MKNKIFPLILVLILGGVASYFWYDSKERTVLAPILPEKNNLEKTQQDLSQGQKPEQTEKPVVTSTPKPTLAPSQSSGVFSSGEEVDAPDILVLESIFDGSSFSPKILDIKAGDIIIFRNTSKVPLKIKSIDSSYLEFDSGQDILPGAKFQFKFEKTGSWQYSDERYPDAVGRVNVK